jgi:hypothetical protein
MNGEYVFRIEKRSPEHPLTPQVLVEFGCKEDNPKAIVEAVVAFAELLKMYGSPEKVVEYMKRNAGVQRAKLFVEEVMGR